MSPPHTEPASREYKGKGEQYHDTYETSARTDPARRPRQTGVYTSNKTHGQGKTQGGKATSKRDHVTPTEGHSVQHDTPKGASETHHGHSHFQQAWCPAQRRKGPTPNMQEDDEVPTSSHQRPKHEPIHPIPMPKYSPKRKGQGEERPDETTPPNSRRLTNGNKGYKGDDNVPESVDERRLPKYKGS